MAGIVAAAALGASKISMVRKPSCWLSWRSPKPTEVYKRSSPTKAGIGATMARSGSQTTKTARSWMTIASLPIAARRNGLTTRLPPPLPTMYPWWKKSVFPPGRSSPPPERQCWTSVRTLPAMFLSGAMPKPGRRLLCVLAKCWIKTGNLPKRISS